MYEPLEAARLAALDKIATWLERDDLARILVDRIGRGGKQNMIRGSEITTDVIAHMGEPKEHAVLEAVLGAHGDLGGTIQLRCEFLAPEGGTAPSPQRHRIPLGSRPASTRSNSRGADAAAEALADSMQSMTNSLRESHDGLSVRLVESLERHAGVQSAELRQQMDMSLAYNAEILKLQLRISELSGELRLHEILSAQQAQTDPGQWTELLKELIPVAGDALGSIFGGKNVTPVAVSGPEAPAPTPTEAPPTA